MIRLRNKCGFLLVGSFATIIVLTILSAAIFAKSINEDLIARENYGDLSAKYNAEKGFECAYYELINHGTSWKTHYFDPEDTDPTFLYDYGTPLHVFLDTIAEHDGGTGEYKALNDKFFTKVYLDEGDGQFAILARGVSDTTDNSYLMAAKVSISTLYEYFWFSPYSMYMGWTTFLAEGGSIHTNGNLKFADSVVIQNINTLEAAQYISYNTYAYMPPEDVAYDQYGNVIGDAPSWNDILYWMRDPWWDPQNLNGEEYDYYHHHDGKVYGERSGLFMDNPAFNGELPAGPGNELYATCEGDFANCILPEGNCELATGHDPNLINEDLYMYSDYYIYGDAAPGERYHRSVRINANGQPEERIPTRLSSSYDWDLFWRTSGGLWWGGTRYYYPNPVSPVDIPANFTNTYEQLGAWQDWMPTSLDGVILEHNTGAEHITPPRINSATYFNQAQSEGMYINNFEECSKEIAIQVHIEGQPEPLLICPEPDGDYVSPVSGKTIARNRSFHDTNSWQLKENIISLDVYRMKTDGIWPQNGVVYSDYDLALAKARSLLAPLTTVSRENIYLMGDYNVGEAGHDWQPSAIIAAKRAFTVSESFLDEMERIAGITEGGLPYTIHNPDYPYVEDEDWHEGHWEMLYEDEMAPVAGEDDNGIVEYYVSIVGYRAYPPAVLERWGESGYTRKVVGSFINLENNNFEWKEFDEGSSWPIFDWNKSRKCTNPEFTSAFPGSPCRSEGLAGWPWDMTSHGPSSSNNIFQYETRYTPDVLPPGELPGYFASITIRLVDNDYNFSHHPAGLYTAGE